MVLVNKDKGRLGLTRTGPSVTALCFVRTNYVGLGSNSEISIFCGLALIFYFNFHTFQLIQCIIIYNIPLYSINFSSVKGMGTSRHNNSVFYSNPGFGICVD